MSKIKLLGLGGLDENGKNNYVIEIDKDIYVFDCGLKYANESLYGIDYIIPDFSYLVKNRKRIRGVFITHAHLENMGSTSDLLKAIPELKIYATKFTKYILEQNGVNSKNIVEIKPHKKLIFGNISIFPMSVSHSAPDAVMYVINTKDGAICYTGDFIIDPSMNGAYGTDLGKLAYIGKQGVLLLLCESVFSEKIGHTSPKHKLTDFFKDTLNRHENRLIFNVLPHHLYTIQDIFNAAANSHRKIVIMGKYLQNIVNYASTEGYLHFDQSILGDLSNLEDRNSILLVTENRDNPYSSITKILDGYDKFIKFKENDTVVFASPRYDASEKTLVKLENELSVNGVNIVSIPTAKTLSHHASSEDLMMMIDLMKPRYYMPVKGEYRYMVGNANLASELGIPADHILLKQNGDVVNIDNGLLIDKPEIIKVNDVLIDGKSNDDVGELVIKDREMLSENGIVLIGATISKKTKTILVGPEVTTRGFIYVKDSKEMIEEIKKICLEIIERNISAHYVEYNKIKNEIREELGRFLYEETECKPMIIAVVQEV